MRAEDLWARLAAQGEPRKPAELVAGRLAASGRAPDPGEGLKAYGLCSKSLPLTWASSPGTGTGSPELRPAP